MVVTLAYPSADIKISPVFASTSPYTCTYTSATATPTDKAKRRTPSVAVALMAILESDAKATEPSATIEPVSLINI